MNADRHQKVNADHLKRDAYLYIRQSTLRQLLENTESTKGSTRYGRVLSPWAGRSSGSSSSTMIWGIGRVRRRSRGIPEAGGRRWYGKGRYRAGSGSVPTGA